MGRRNPGSFRIDYQHHRTGETNGDAHLKSILFHHQVVVPVTAGKLDLRAVADFYAEFDGRAASASQSRLWENNSGFRENGFRAFLGVEDGPAQLTSLSYFRG